MRRSLFALFFTSALLSVTACQQEKKELLALSAAATGYSIWTRRHIFAALALGMSGYALGGVFLLEPAPDVALVQILVETLGTVLIMVMIARMDAINGRLRVDAMRDLWATSMIGKVRDVAIAMIIGGAVALVAVSTVASRPQYSAHSGSPGSVSRMISQRPSRKSANDRVRFDSSGKRTT